MLQLCGPDKVVAGDARYAEQIEEFLAVCIAEVDGGKALSSS
jgi:hypothetical protein